MGVSQVTGRYKGRYTRKMFALWIAVCVWPAVAQLASTASAVSERDFLGDMPVVLSVSRLAQRLDEAPGAVTVLDRDFIRISGARDVADLLRMVPGFQSTNSFETDAPLATYHGRSDEWANRIQVLVDGRSVYSGYLQGSAGLGLETIAMTDIERIEVLRGSNSAAYGARAFLGVINIVSRDVRDTLGVAANVHAGNTGIADVALRIGGATDQATYRLSVDNRADEGLRGANGRNRVSRLNMAAALELAKGESLDLRAGALGIDAGRGTLGDDGNAARMRYLGSQFFQLDWRKPVTDNQDVLLSFSSTANTHRDSFPYLTNAQGVNYYGISIDFSAREVNHALTFQHTIRNSAQVRSVWGLELRQEKVSSISSFDARGQVESNFSRLFGNLEWRLKSDLVLNAGAMAESSNIGGDTVSPRLMLNWHASPGHTLRSGISSAFRPPSAYEKYAAVRYYDVNGQNPITTVQSSGAVGPERIEARELGYNLSLDNHTWSADLRVFQEHISDGIERPASVSPTDYRNIENYDINGAEYPLQWKPSSSTLFFLTQTWTSISNASRFKTAHGAPSSALSLAAMHRLSSGFDVSVMHQQADNISLIGNQQLYATERTDLRVSKPMRLWGSKSELAFTVQNLGSPYKDSNKDFYFDRRVFVSLRIDN